MNEPSILEQNIFECDNQIEKWMRRAVIAADNEDTRAYDEAIEWVMFYHDSRRVCAFALAHPDDFG